MPKPFVGIDGIARLITGGYVGVDGVARKLVRGYVGVDGLARLCWSEDTLIDFTYIEENGRTVLTGWKGTYLGEPSTKIIIPDSEKIIEI